MIQREVTLLYKCRCCGRSSSQGPMKMMLPPLGEDAKRMVLKDMGTTIDWCHEDLCDGLTVKDLTALRLE